MDDSKMIMSIEDRQYFWETLCSLDGEDLVKDTQILREKIKVPKFLFRFRPVTINNVEALRTNKMFLSTSNYYDDPFDTFLRIDLNGIQTEMNSYFTDSNKLNFNINNFKTLVGDNLNSYLGINTLDEFNSESVIRFLQGGVCSSFLGELSDLRHEIKKDTWSVCFSEDGYNESLWMKYADQHKGFAVMYNTEEIDEKLLCGKLEKCTNCGIKNYGVELYPICYSDEKYDATRFAQYVLLKKLENNIPVKEILNPIYKSLGNMNWEKQKTTLIKKKCHEYDKEWRIVSGANFKPPAMMEWIPSAIILGLNIGANEENLVVSSAIQAGVEKIYRAIISEIGDLEYQLVWTLENKKG